MQITPLLGTKKDTIMKNYLFILITITLFTLSCNTDKKTTIPKKISWENRKTTLSSTDHLHKGSTYLPVYSQIYHRFDHHTFSLTITVSIRNMSDKNSIYLTRVDYYNTEGTKIRQYIDHMIYVNPMETLEIVIEEDDKEGGSGGNFIFDWMSSSANEKPLMEAVMISTYGQQGLSFSTRGVEL